MSSQQLDEEAILEVARAISHGDIRGKYLSQVCNDPEVRLRLEQRVKLRRRWQFGLRSLFVVMVVAAVVSALLAVSFNSAQRAQRLAERERQRAIQAMKQAQAASMQQRQAADLEAKARSSNSSSEEDAP